MRWAALLIGGLAIWLTGCGPAPDTRSPTAKAKLGRKCPDHRLRDKHDPCAPNYLPPAPPRIKRDRFD